MAETVKTQSALLTEMADDGNNTAEEVRNGIVSMWTPGAYRYLDHRLPSETPHADDDFFNADSSADYTEVTPAGTIAWTIDHGLLSVQWEDATAGDLRGFMKAITSAAAPMTIETRVNLLATSATGVNNSAGIIFSDGTTDASNIHGFALFTTSSTSDWGFRSLEGTFTARAVDQTISGGFVVGTGAIYLRAVWVSANTWNFAYSIDGVSWTNAGFADDSDTLTPTHIGFFVEGDYTLPTFASFDYLRVYDSDLNV